MNFSFKIEKKLTNGLGRAGVLSTPNGVIETPAFVSVGTKASVKTLSPEQIRETGSQVVLSNTYHLYLEPGEKIVKEAGGLSKYMNWNGPTMTDSGGFQAFSLGVAFGKKMNKLAEVKQEKNDKERETVAQMAKITEDGVEFKSVIDGSTHFFTPERSIEIQNDIGADMIFAFDECTSPIASYDYQKEAMDRTHRWATRCLDKHQGFKDRQALFGIVQGGRFEDLRRESSKVIGSMDFFGFGIGGSFEKEDMNNAVRIVNEILPEEKPKHLLGIGDPLDLFDAVENGCDLFDCVAPTRIGRHGTLYSKNGLIHITNSTYRSDFSPVIEGCGCYTCRNFTKSYLCHLFRAHEYLAYTLASIHNMFFVVNLVKEMRVRILVGGFKEMKDSFLRSFR